MHLTLLVSDLVPPPAFFPATDLPRLPTLEKLIGTGMCRNSPGTSLEDALLQEIGVDSPAAPLTLLADDGDPGRDTWLRADPVHLHISRDNVQLMDSHVLQPTEAEARDIVDSINRHLAGDGLQIEARDAARWYMRIAADDVPATTPLWRVAGRSVFEHLPVQQGRTNWRALQNEIQMLLFDHPVNQARELSGQPAINGIWFWGGGSLPDMPTSATYQNMTARLALARGLAQHANLPLEDLPLSFPELALSPGKTLVVLHQATRELRANDAAAWQKVVTNIEKSWIEPASRALNDGQILSLTLLLPNETFTLAADITRGSSWKFWRRAKPLATYA